LGELVVEKLAPIQQRYNEITADVATIQQIMAEGAEKARQVASITVKAARKAIGMD